MKTLNTYFLFLLILYGVNNSFGQNSFKQDIADIKYKYLELAEFPGYVKKAAFVSELDSEDNKKYITGEVFGYYNKGKLTIIKEYTKHELGKRTREFYLYEGKLIFVYEQIQQQQIDTQANGEITKRPVIVFSCGYYLKNERLIQKTPKGSVSPYPTGLANGKLKEQFLTLVALYRKQLEEVKEIEKK